MSEEKPVYKKPSFPVALNKLLDGYGIADFAFVGIGVDSSKELIWEAGNNESGDRDRIDVLYAEIARIQNQMMSYSERTTKNRRKVQDGS